MRRLRRDTRMYENEIIEGNYDKHESGTESNIIEDIHHSFVLLLKGI